MFLKILVLFSVLCVSVLAQYYEDKRCRCVCPSAAQVTNNSKKSNRRLYIAYVPPNQCNCDGVVLPRIDDVIKEQSQAFCLQCECKYETRSTTVIMVVVILVLWMITLLLGYLFFLITLDPLLNKNARTKSYQEQGTEESINLLVQGEEIED